MEVALVMNGNQPIYNDVGEILVYDVKSFETFFVEATPEILSMVPRPQEVSKNKSEQVNLLSDVEHVDPSLDVNMEEDSTFDKTTTSKARAYWDYGATIVLINKYKAYYALFADDLHKNAEVWDMIASEFRKEGYSFTPSNCENRWKYIRGKYIKKKDNDSDSNTGGSYFEFEYFNEIPQ